MRDPPSKKEFLLLPRIVHIVLFLAVLLGILSLLTMCTQEKPRAATVRVIEVIEREDDYAYVVRMKHTEEREVLYSKERLPLPLFVDVDVEISDDTIQYPRQEVRP